MLLICIDCWQSGKHYIEASTKEIALQRLTAALNDETTDEDPFLTIKELSSKYTHKYGVFRAATLVDQFDLYYEHTMTPREMAFGWRELSRK